MPVFNGSPLHPLVADAIITVEKYAAVGVAHI
jgi:hypothetical protein